jgi:hypothetical protein
MTRPYRKQQEPTCLPIAGGRSVDQGSIGKHGGRGRCSRTKAPKQRGTQGGTGWGPDAPGAQRQGSEMHSQ